MHVAGAITRSQYVAHWRHSLTSVRRTIRATYGFYAASGVPAVRGWGEVFGARPTSLMRADVTTILLVEDDPVLATFLADNLSADGYEPVVAETIRDGLRL